MSANSDQPLDCTPAFSCGDAVAIAQSAFGIAGAAQPLPSERDQNFALTTREGTRYVLKIAKSDEDPQVLDFQNSALKHLHSHPTGLCIPALIPARDGADLVQIRGMGGRSYFSRLLSWIEGDIFVHASPHDAALLDSLGTSLAAVDAALASFRHPAMNRKLHWDLRHVGLALEHLPLLAPPRRDLVGRFRAGWEKVDWAALRSSVIHGDANDYNLIVREGCVVGLLDFGDMVHSATICDLAVVLAYAMLDQPDPIAAAVTVASAYHRKYPLTEYEIEALFPLAVSRSCMSVCYAAYNARVKSEDRYQLVTQGPAWTLLERLAQLPADLAVEALRAGCLQL